MRVLPHDVEAEAALVGWCLLKPGEAWRVLDRVSPDEFYRPAWAEAIGVLRAGLVTENELVDRTSVSGADVVSALGSAAMPSTVDALCDRVTDLAFRRRVIGAAAEAVEAARDVSAETGTAVEVLRGLVDDADRPSSVQATEADEFLAVSDDPYDWLVPGWLERGDRMLLTAGEGVGKSYLLRQIAVAIAGGVHPFTQTRIVPKRVLLVDVENLPRRVRRELRPLVRLVEKDWNPGNLSVEVRVGGLDLAKQADVRWLAGLCASHRPDLLVIGPIYQLHGAPERGDQGGENHARQLARTLDRLRERFGFALLMETHAPHGSMGTRDLRPFGSSVWMRWPEFGVGLRRDRDLPGRAFKLEHWRGPRDRREWPETLEHGKPWPWVATYKDTPVMAYEGSF